MKDERIIKINRFGKISRIIAKIAFVFAIIGAVATAGVGIASAFIPSDIAKVEVNGTANVQIDEKYLNIGKMILSEVNEGMTEEGQTLEIAGSEYEYVSADINGDTISIDYKLLNNKIGVRNFAGFMAGACLEIINVAVLLFFVIALCKAVENCQSPFEENVIRKMKSLAIAFIPWVVINGVSQSISAFAFSGKFDLNIGFDLGIVLVVLVFVMLITVFRYGAMLQQQSDETL